MREIRMTQRFSILLAWYDIWIGAFVDISKRKLYIFPLPMIGIIYKL